MWVWKFSHVAYAGECCHPQLCLLKALCNKQTEICSHFSCWGLSAVLRPLSFHLDVIEQEELCWQGDCVVWGEQSAVALKA